MAKHDPNKKPKFEFFNNKEFSFGFELKTGRMHDSFEFWTIDGRSPTLFLVDVMHHFDPNEELINEYGVGSSLNKLWGAEEFWHEEIFRHWMDDFVRYFAYARYRKSYAETVGNEKDKSREAERARDDVFKYINGL